MTIKKRLRLMIAALFGVIIFLSKFYLPTPMDKMVILAQGLMLGLGALIIGGFGGTYVALIGGLLTSILKAGFAPFSLIFSLVFGLTTDASFQALKIREQARVKTARSIAASAFSAAVTGVSSMYTTVMTGFIPMIPTLFAVIILAGILNGAVAGYLISAIWNRYLMRYF